MAADTVAAMANPTHLKSRWAALPVLLAGAFMVVLDFFIVNVALPSIATDLGAGEIARMGRGPLRPVVRGVPHHRRPARR